MAEKHYLTVNYDGSIFQYSGEEKEGYIKFTNTKNKVSYRKYFNQGVEGNLLWVNRKKNDRLNNREELQLVLGSGDDTFYVTFVVMNQNGDSIDDFTESLLRYLPNMDKGSVYNIKSWKMNRGDVIKGEEVKYDNSGVTIKFGGEKLKPALTFKTEKNPAGTIPMLEWKEIAGSKKPTASSKEEKLIYLYDVLEKECARLGFEESTSQSAPQNTPKETNKPKAEKKELPKVNPKEAFSAPSNSFIDDDEDDMLPF